MKILDNGVLRDMTPEEIKADREVDSFLDKLIPPKDNKQAIEEFINRLAEADDVMEIVEIAKDIKEKIGGNE